MSFVTISVVPHTHHGQRRVMRENSGNRRCRLLMRVEMETCNRTERLHTLY